MHCFNHSEADAVGICKVCQKGLCHACAADLQHGIACKDKHEALAEAVHHMVSRGTRIQGAVRKAGYVTPISYGFIGLLFLGFGWLGDSKAAEFLLYMGFGFIALAAVVFVVNMRASGASKRDAIE
jgi:hypothetical protein